MIVPAPFAAWAKLQIRLIKWKQRVAVQKADQAKQARDAFYQKLKRHNAKVSKIKK